MEGGENMKIDTKQINGVIAVVFGVLVFALPNVVNYLIALFFIIWGIVALIPTKK